jgi:hypothetical protein
MQQRHEEWSVLLEEIQKVMNTVLLCNSIAPTFATVCMFISKQSTQFKYFYILKTVSILVYVFSRQITRYNLFLKFIKGSYSIKYMLLIAVLIYVTKE